MQVGGFTVLIEKIVGHTKTTIHDGFTVFIYDMLSALVFLHLGFLSIVLHCFWRQSGSYLIFFSALGHSHFRFKSEYRYKQEYFEH